MTKRFSLILFFCFCLVAPALCTPRSFKAAVVEYVPQVPSGHYLTQEQASVVMQSNAAAYRNYALQAAADLIVFPEYGLFGDLFWDRRDIFPFLEEIPDPASTKIINPCLGDESSLQKNSSASIFQKLSCIAREAHVFLVADLGEKVPCTPDSALPCPSDGFWQFNTQVAFGQDGQYLQKYRKSHLYVNESRLYDQPLEADLRYFDTPFGRVGMFICFDIFFQAPAQELASKFGIDIFVDSLYWDNTDYLPLMSAVQMQQGFSLALGSVLLASNIGRFGWLDSGSGIYHNGLALNYTFNPTNSPRSVLMTAEIELANRTEASGRQLPTAVDYPTSHSSNSLKDIAIEGGGLLSARKIQVADSYKIRPFTIYTQHNTQTIKASMGSVTCTLSFRAFSYTPLQYALMAIDGSMFSSLLNGTLCALIRCPNGNCNDIEISLPLAGFQEFQLSAAGLGPQAAVFPMVSTTKGQLVPISQWEFHKTGQIAVLASQSISSPLHVLNLVLYSNKP